MLSWHPTLSNLPAISTDAFTSNLIQLFTGVISKTGASTGFAEVNSVNDMRQRVANRMQSLLNRSWRNTGACFIFSRSYPIGGNSSLTSIFQD